MKKPILSVLLVLSCLFSKAQNKYFKDIQKSSNEFTGVTNYDSPGYGGLSFQRTFKNDSLISTTVTITCTCPIAEYNVRGMYIKLDDGSVIKDELNKPVIQYNSINGYDYYCSMWLTSDQMNMLLSHKVVKFAIADLMKDVSNKNSERYEAYIMALSQIKKP